MKPSDHTPMMNLYFTDPMVLMQGAFCKVIIKKTLALNSFTPI